MMIVEEVESGRGEERVIKCDSQEGKVERERERERALFIHG
jgi:hypothetical protein